VESNLLAREILQPRELGAGKAEHAEARRVRAQQASSLLYVSGHLIDRELRDQLWELAHAYREPLESTDRYDAPQALGNR